MRNGHPKFQYSLLIILCNITRLCQPGAQEGYDFLLMCPFRKMVYKGRMKQLVLGELCLFGNPSHLLFPHLFHLILNLLYIPGLQHISNLYHIPACKHIPHRNR